MSLSLLRWELESVSDLQKVSDESLREGFGKAIESKFRTSERIFQVPPQGWIGYIFTWDFLQMSFWSPGVGNLYWLFLTAQWSVKIIQNQTFLQSFPTKTKESNISRKTALYKKVISSTVNWKAGQEYKQNKRLGDFIAVNWGVSHLKAFDFSVKQER